MAIRKTARKKTAAKKRGSGLAKYRTAVKKATATKTRMITTLEKRITKLKTEKAKIVKAVSKKLKR